MLTQHQLVPRQIADARKEPLAEDAAWDLLAKAGVVVPTGRLTALAAERLPGPALMVVNKAIGFRILATSGKSIFKRFGRNVPLIGGAVGAGLDGWVLHKIADKAREEFVTAAPQITA